MAMTPKEIGRAAGRIFAAAIPSNWVIRNQQDQEDYGIDYEIEVMLPGDSRADSSSRSRRRVCRVNAASSITLSGCRVGE
jgi:hypothetical protein